MGPAHTRCIEHSTVDARDGRVDRYYDPSTDQFLSVDPDLAETGQPYAFTGDDPLNATDPLGLKCKKGHSCPGARRAPSVSSTLTKSRVVIPDFLGTGIFQSPSAPFAHRPQLGRCRWLGSPGMVMSARSQITQAGLSVVSTLEAYRSLKRLGPD